ncbi:sensor histidine kinase [Roseateles sp. DAIF2]|uniref:sensor histidine kinase n=1 Tax=Roseateles sp. DAIF2 TaxID=2714952 RepID=UPI0018A2D1F9|nr:histidine kinase [Roseateles sp. DAIF2]QPF75586.1 sensor histidine kinase [Roseateles sp. DAIF2]
MPPSSAQQAFLQVFNLRAIAAVFYFCCCVALSRSLSWYGGDGTGLDWLFSALRYTRQTTITGLALLLAVALVEAWLARPGRRWAIPLRSLAIVSGAMAGMFGRHLMARTDDPSAEWKWSWALSTTLLWTLLGGVAYALLLTARAERQTRQQLLATARRHETLQAQQLEAQLSALNAQIEPHFLFNTLANVKRLYETAPERGRDMLVSLIAYLRAALPSMRRSESTLGQELELVRSYLTILQMRMGERLAFEIEAEPALLSARLPPMVLPTLVENAIKHGLSPLPEGGRIHISAQQRSADELAVEVRDNGQGFAASGGSGVGLANTRARLAALFGPRAALELEAAEPRGVVARVRLPLAGVQT